MSYESCAKIKLYFLTALNSADFTNIYDCVFQCHLFSGRLNVQPFRQTRPTGVICL